MPTPNKSVISASGIGKSYGTFTVLKNIDLSIQEGQKIGLVGPNGIGKSTLLRILAGFEKPDEGETVRSKSIRIGYIPQAFNKYHDHTVRQFIETVVEQPEASKIERFFAILNMDTSLLERRLGELSGGEKTKVALARIFLAGQDVLLLDEPTNNLDIETLEILERFVRESAKTFLIISHDREFLNNVVSRIFEIDEFERNLHSYDGNFSSYMLKRRERIEKQWSEYKDSMDKKERMQTTINDKMRRAEEMPNAAKRDNDKMQRDFKIEHGQKAFHRGAVLLKRKLERMEDVPRPKNPLPLNLKFDVDERSGEKVFELIDVTKKLPDRILGPITLTVHYGDTVLITGNNGSGKSTILKLMMQKLLPDAGTVTSGTRLDMGYLPQEEDIVSENSVKDEFLKHVPIEEGLARRTLNRFGLSAGDVDKKIRDLSSGERSRLILSILMGKKVNCLILDEPSNHLDIEALESLQNALKEFRGTLIVVSHDRYFINHLEFTKKLLLRKGILEETKRQIGETL